MRSFLRSVLASFGLICAAPAQASSYHIIYEFAGTPDGATPEAGLIADPQGRLYGTTTIGGASGLGTVFRLTRPVSGNGPWTEEILHDFAGSEGSLPFSGLTMDAAGNLYGTTLEGGTFEAGEAYQLDNVAGWPLTILHSFGRKSDGNSPQAGVVFGLSGLLYGTSASGGFRNAGLAFSLSPLGATVESARIAQFFFVTTGSGPGPLVASPDGRLFGVTDNYAPLQDGAAFALSADAAGIWHQKTIYVFGSKLNDVMNSQNALIVGHNKLKGALFGCSGGGTHSQGAVFQLTPATGAGGQATETILYNFGDQPFDPEASPSSPCSLTQDAATGKLYGVTDGGGMVTNTNPFGDGAFFELAPPQTVGGAWTETVLHEFNGNDDAGASPYGEPLQIGGLFYGTAAVTGPNMPNGSGVVWEITP